jgi:hypothetical protein
MIKTLKDDKIKHSDVIDILKDNLLKLIASKIWYKYTPTRYFSKIEGNYYYVIRKGELLYHEMDNDGQMIRYEIFSLIESKLEETDDKKEISDLEILYEEFDCIVDVVCQSVKNSKPIIEKIFEFDNIKRFGKVILEYRDGTIFESRVKNKEELEIILEDNLDDVGKIQIGNKKLIRHDILTQQYMDIETKILLDEENYELLGWFKKLKDEK